jgi:hypothetical protein
VSQVEQSRFDRVAPRRALMRGMTIGAARAPPTGPDVLARRRQRRRDPNIRCRDRRIHPRAARHRPGQDADPGRKPRTSKRFAWPAEAALVSPHAVGYIAADRRGASRPWRPRRGGRVVNRTALEMRNTGNRIGGSNPSLSANSPQPEILQLTGAAKMPCRGGILRARLWTAPKVVKIRSFSPGFFSLKL